MANLTQEQEKAILADKARFLKLYVAAGKAVEKEAMKVNGFTFDERGMAMAAFNRTLAKFFPDQSVEISWDEACRIGDLLQG